MRSRNLEFDPNVGQRGVVLSRADLIIHYLSLQSPDCGRKHPRQRASPSPIAMLYFMKSKCFAVITE